MSSLRKGGDRSVLFRVVKKTDPDPEDAEQVEWERTTIAYMSDGTVHRKADWRSKSPARTHGGAWKKDRAAFKQLLAKGKATARTKLEQVRDEYKSKGWMVEVDNLKTRLSESQVDEGLAPTPQGFHTFLIAALTQYDEAQKTKAFSQTRKTSTRRMVHYNPHALGIYFRNAQEIQKEMGTRMSSTEEKDLRAYRVEVGDSFETKFPPVKKTLKAIDDYLNSGKVPKYPGAKASRARTPRSKAPAKKVIESRDLAWVFRNPDHVMRLVVEEYENDLADSIVTVEMESGEFDFLASQDVLEGVIHHPRLTGIPVSWFGEDAEGAYLPPSETETLLASVGVQCAGVRMDEGELGVIDEAEEAHEIMRIRARRKAGAIRNHNPGMEDTEDDGEGTYSFMSNGVVIRESYRWGKKLYGKIDPKKIRAAIKTLMQTASAVAGKDVEVYSIEKMMESDELDEALGDSLEEMTSGSVPSSAAPARDSWQDENIPELEEDPDELDEVSYKALSKRKILSKGFAQAIVKAKKTAVHRVATGTHRDDSREYRRLAYGYIALTLDQGDNIALQSLKPLSDAELTTLMNNIRIAAGWRPISESGIDEDSGFEEGELAEKFSFVRLSKKRLLSKAFAKEVASAKKSQVHRIATGPDMADVDEYRRIAHGYVSLTLKKGENIASQSLDQLGADDLLVLMNNIRQASGWKVVKKAVAAAEGVDEISSAVEEVFHQNEDGVQATAAQLACAIGCEESDVLPALIRMVSEGVLSFSREDGYSLREAKKVSRQEHKARVERALRKQGTRKMRPIDKDEYPPIKGMEGPFNFRQGVLYYDPKEGRYYDSKKDMYLAVDDIPEDTDETTTSGSVGGYRTAALGKPENRGRVGGVRDDGPDKKGPKSRFSPPAVGASDDSVGEGLEDKRTPPGFVAGKPKGSHYVCENCRFFDAKKKGKECVVYAYPVGPQDYCEAIQLTEKAGERTEDADTKARIKAFDAKEESLNEVDVKPRKRSMTEAKALGLAKRYAGAKSDLKRVGGESTEFGQFHVFEREVDEGEAAFLSVMDDGDVDEHETRKEALSAGRQVLREREAEFKSCARGCSESELVPFEFPESEVETFVLAAQSLGLPNSTDLALENGTFRVDVSEDQATQLQELVGV